MKNFIWTILFFTLSLKATGQSMLAQEISINADSFSWVYNNENFMVVSSDYSLSYENDCTKPGIPYLAAQILLPADTKVDSVTCEVADKMLFGTGSLMNNPEIVPLMENAPPIIAHKGNCASISQRVTSCNTMFYQQYSVALVNYTPFLYDEIQEKMYLHQRITLNVYYSQAYSRNIIRRSDSKDFISQNVLNPSDIDNFYAPILLSPSQSDTIDYVIVTADSLCNAYNEFRLWREGRGLRTKVIKLSEIENTYPGEVIQEKIKNCLYQNYLQNSIQYVLLGGDVDIIPTQTCVRSYADTLCFIPSDMYYASFGGNFYWNNNSNNFYGESDDNINYVQDIAIGRWPVRNCNEIIECTRKLIEYESGNSNVLYSKMFLTGTQRNTTQNNISDIHYKLLKMFNENVSNSNVKLDYLFDTGTTIGDLTFNRSGLQLAFEDGYNISVVSCHGNVSLWSAAPRPSYTSNQARLQSSSGLPIILSNACFTNKFTKATALGRTIFSNNQCGNICYWGNSHFGWGTSYYYNQGRGIETIGYFLSSLYQDDETYIGNICRNALAKQMIQYNDDYSKWTWLSMNLLGDPTMEITTSPLKTLHPIHLQRTQKGLRIDTDDIGVSMTMISGIDADNAYVEHRKNCNSHTFSNEHITNSRIYIIKRGYKPLIIPLHEIQNLLIDDCAITNEEEYNATQVVLGSSSHAPAKVIDGGKLNITTSGSVNVKGLNLKNGSFNIKRTTNN